MVSVLWLISDIFHSRNVTDFCTFGPKKVFVFLYKRNIAGEGCKEGFVQVQINN